MIIFGWGKTMTKNYGPVKTYRCGRCNNISEWSLFKVSTWFTLYFIPVFPYSFKRLLVCPVCGACHELDKQEFEELRPGNASKTPESSQISSFDYNFDENGAAARKTETQVNYLRQMEELERERQQRFKDSSSES